MSVTLEALAAGAAALAIYLLTLQRGVSLPDSAVIMEAMQGPVVSAFACNHTLNNLIGWVVCRVLPFGSLAWRCNAVSALYGAGVVGLLYALSRRLGGSRTLAGVCAASLAVSHGVWWHATVVENYGLSAVLFLLCALLLLSDLTAAPKARRRLFALFLLAGLSLLNHLQNGVLLVGCAAALLAGRTWPVRGWGWAAAGAGLGAAPVVAIAAWEVGSGRAGDDWLGWLVGGGGFEQVMFSYGVWGGFPELARLWAWHHPGPFLVACAAGLAWMAVLAVAPVARSEEAPSRAAFPVDAAPSPRDQAGKAARAPLLLGSITPKRARPRADALRRLAWLVWVAVAGNTGFFLGYETWDRFSFLLITFVAAAVAAAGLLAALERRSSRQVRRALLLVLTAGVAVAPPFYRWQARLVHDSHSGWLTRGFGDVAAAYHGRYDLAGMLLDPVRRDSGSIERFVRAALAALPPGAVWVDDGSTYYQAEWLQRREGLRPDVRLELIANPVMRGHGTEAHALAMRLQWRGGEERWFLVADQGPCAQVADALRPFGWRVVPFEAGKGIRLYEVERVAEP